MRYLFSHYLKLRGLLSICLVTFLWVNSLNVTAGTTLDNGFDKLLVNSDLVVYGQFTKTQSVWRGNKIFTVGTFQVEQMIKGQQLASVDVEMIGGTAMHPRLNAPVTMKASDGVGFESGERAVLLLRKLQGKTYQISGMSRGKIAVYDDPDTGEIKVSGLRKIQASTSTNNGSETTLSGEAMSLAEFIKFSQGVIERQGGKQ